MVLNKNLAGALEYKADSAMHKKRAKLHLAKLDCPMVFLTSEKSVENNHNNVAKAKLMKVNSENIGKPNAAMTKQIAAICWYLFG